MQGPRHIYQLGEIGPAAFHSCLLPGYDDRYSSREGVSFRGSGVSLSENHVLFYGSSITSGENVAITVRPHGVTGAFSSQWLLKDFGPPWWTILLSWPGPSLSPEWKEEVRWWLLENRWAVGVLMQIPLHPCFCTRTPLWWVRGLISCT